MNYGLELKPGNMNQLLILTKLCKGTNDAVYTEPHMRNYSLFETYWLHMRSHNLIENWTPFEIVCYLWQIYNISNRGTRSAYLTLETHLALQVFLNPINVTICMSQMQGQFTMCIISTT